ncbi:hypothetical protein ACFQZC_02510 [Streptacidiphilus monticola]
MAADHPAGAWKVPVRWLGGSLRPVGGAVGSLLREVEVHHTDLDMGHRPADWPEQFVVRELATTVDRLRRRPDAPAMVLHVAGGAGAHAVGGGAGPRVSGPAAELLGWLSGRIDGSALSVDPPGRLPQVPPWRS